MNYGISVLFRTIPLLMALFCFGYGAFVLDMGTDPAKNVAGPVVMSLGMICIALFATAATIIRQIIHTYNTVVLYALPVLGYLAALLTFICGWEYISEAATASHFVAIRIGHGGNKLSSLPAWQRPPLLPPGSPLYLPIPKRRKTMCPHKPLTAHKVSFL